MKIKVLDLSVVDKNNNVEMMSERDLFEYEGGSWEGFIEAINSSNLDGEYFDIEDVDKDVFIIEDGGEAFRLNDAIYINVSWRGSVCRVWEEDDLDQINYFDVKLGY